MSLRTSSTPHAVMMKQNTLHDTSCTSAVGHSAQIDSEVSGTGETLNDLIQAGDPLARKSNPTQLRNTPSSGSPLEDLPGAADAVWQKSEVDVHAETDASKSNRPTLPKSTRPAVSQRNSTRRSSGAPGSHRSSNPPSRRSSFASQQPVNSYNRRPSFPIGSISATYDRPRREDPFLVHRRSTQIFQTLESPQRVQSRMRSDDQGWQVAPIFPDLPRVPSTVVATEQGFAISQAEEKDPDLQHHYENHVPATVIDWTLPSTRRLEYRQIDKSCQGFRGIWRRLAPRWCRRNSRLNFFDGNDSDVGSVRRYRLDLPEVEKERNADSVEITEREIELNLGKIRRKWSCFRLRDLPRRS
ncbi:hypothetical protein MMC07_005167 [Pseudocyphellaria aurata]|nr:hypothetical protein [Pseudocyphellaria aurata]